MIPQLWTFHKRGQTFEYLATMPKNATSTLAQNIRELKERNGLTLVEMQRRSGMSKSQIGYLLNYRDTSDRHPTTQTLEALAHAFGLDAWQLLAPDLGMRLHAQPHKPPIVDGNLLTTSLSTAFSAFRASGRLPTDAQVAAAAVFVYVYVQRGKRMKDAEKEVRALLATAKTTAPDFTV